MATNNTDKLAEAIQEILEEQIEGLDLSDAAETAVGEAVENYDFEKDIERAVEDYDFNAAINSVVEDYDFSSAAEGALKEAINDTEQFGLEAEHSVQVVLESKEFKEKLLTLTRQVMKEVAEEAAASTQLAKAQVEIKQQWDKVKELLVKGKVKVKGLFGK